MKATTVKQVLIATRWILDKYGWCQNFFFQDKSGRALNSSSINAQSLGGCCLEGAIILVEAEDSLKYQANNLIISKEGSVICWNDELGRTKQQVLNMLDTLIQEQP